MFELSFAKETVNVFIFQYLFNLFDSNFLGVGFLCIQKFKTWP
jgi:hypothetical protein